MKAYKPSSATYKDSIPIVETTDTNHADNVNQAPKQLIENDIALKEQMDQANPTVSQRIAWKTNDGGEIKTQDIIALV